MNKSHTTLKIVGSVAVVAALAAGTFMFIGSKKDSQTQEPVASNTTTSQSTQTSTTDTQQTSQTSASPTTESSTQTAPSSAIYKDGEYSVTTTYAVPEGDSNSLTTTLTVKNDTITAVTASSKYTNRESAQYVNGFKNSVSGAVVGKKLSGLSFSKIGGASLTTASFNKAINSIASNAKN